MIKGSELQPMVIVMEDLHWADDSSLDLLRSLYGLADKHRLLFVNVFRPSYLNEDVAKVTAQAHETIQIQPLPIKTVKL
jgi:predicted ATPase